MAIRKAKLKGFRFHDLRHTAITDFAEAATPESVMQSIAGHVSREMREHYTHIRTDAKKKAVAALGGTGILDTSSQIRTTKLARRVRKPVILQRPLTQS